MSLDQNERFGPPTKRIKLSNQEDVPESLLSEFDSDNGNSEDVFDFEESEFEIEVFQPNKGASEVKGESTLSLHNSVNYEPMDQTELLELMNTILAEVNEVLGEEKQLTRALMTYYKWDKPRLLEDFYARGKEECCEFAGIELANASEQNTVDNDCCICYEPGDGESISQLDCGHGVCSLCLHSHIIQEVVEKRKSCIQCPQCQVLIKDAKVVEVLGTRFGDFERNLVQKFVETNPKIKWCPAPDHKCNRAIITHIPNISSVSCSCTNNFCFKCGNYAHEPLPCDLLKSWLLLSSKDYESERWIHENTQLCPKCTFPIQKHGGCKIVGCKKCGHSFCWDCLSAVRFHLHFTCVPLPQEPTWLTVVDHVRYPKYLDQYQTNEKWLNLEDSMCEQLLKKIDPVAQSFKILEKEDFFFITEAVLILKSARYTLMSTIAYAYYVKPSHHLNIFEHNQQYLQLATDKLSRILDSDQVGHFGHLQPGTLDKYKIQVMESAGFCKNRRDVLLSHASEGTLELQMAKSTSTLNWWQKKKEF